MTLEPSIGTKQKVFTHRFFCLLDWLFSHGYEVTIGEVYRPVETAKLYAVDGRGVANSLHTLKLAVDINLFYDGNYLTDTKDYAAAGQFWESMSTTDIRCVWGGRFARPDGDHFSIAHGTMG